LTLTTGKVHLKSRDDVAGCVNKFGSGRAYLIGTLLGHALLAYEDKAEQCFPFPSACQCGGQTRQSRQASPASAVLGGQGVWFLFNTTGTPAEETVALENYKTAKDLLAQNCRQHPAGSS
jgi:hypothetical protein